MASSNVKNAPIFSIYHQSISSITEEYKEQNVCKGSFEIKILSLR